MTVSLSTAIYQPGNTADVTTGQMKAVVYAGGFRPAYDDAKMDAIVHRWAFWSDWFGFLRSATWGQSGHETGWFWSRVRPNQVQPEQNNWGGLGADNSGAAGGVFGPVPEFFPNDPVLSAIDHGIVAFMCHLSLYVHGDPEQWPEHTRQFAKFAYRLEAVRWAHNNRRLPNGALLRYLGAVVRIGDWLNGRWAHTGSLPLGVLDNGYAFGIERKANEVHAQPREDTMALTDVIRDRIAAKGIEVHDIRDKMIWHKTLRYERLPNSAWRYIAVHHTAVTRGVRGLQGDIDSWIGHSRYHTQADPERDKEEWPGIAYAIGISLSGRVFILRDLELMGYHAYRANDSSLAVCGDLTTGNTITQAFRRSLDAVLDVLHDASELPGIGGKTDTFGHTELAFIDSRNRGTQCPGDLLGLVKEYRERTNMPSKREFPNGFTLQHGFADFYESKEPDAWTVIGWPVADEIAGVSNGEASVTVQETDVGWLQWNPETNEVRMATRNQALSIETSLGLVPDEPAGVDPEIVRSAITAIDSIADTLELALPGARGAGR